MAELHRFASFDGAEIAYETLGEGWPVILIHGLFSTAELNWARYGHAQRVADAGARVILPEQRAHGRSAKPRTADGWPPDALGRDILALIAHLALEPGGYDLGGYSLGARTTVRAVAMGAEPRRAVLAGMGLEGLTGATRRGEAFTRAIDHRSEHKPGSWEWYAMQFARANGTDLDSARFLLQDVTSIDATGLAETMTMPTLVVCGDADRDNGSAPALAAALPQARLVEIPGTHVTAVTQPALGEMIAEWLRAR
jgi:pimeloyl-ACP methyl ester carboxylesterase